MNMACMGMRVHRSAEDNGGQYSKRGYGPEQAQTYNPSVTVFDPYSRSDPISF